MWIFSSKSKSKSLKPQSITNAYLVESGNNTKVYATLYDALVECKRLELTDVATKAEAAVVTYYGPSLSSHGFEKATSITFEEMPSEIKKEVYQHRVKVKDARDMENERRQILAESIADKWNIIVKECKAKIEKAMRDKDNAIQSYVKDKSMTSSRVREVFDTKTNDIKGFINNARNLGNTLIKEKTDMDINIDDLIVSGLITDPRDATIDPFYLTYTSVHSAISNGAASSNVAVAASIAAAASTSILP